MKFQSYHHQNEIQEFHCQKTGLERNNRYTVKSLIKMKNTLNTLQRDTNITWFIQTMGYVQIEISSPCITVQKDEGIQPAAISMHFLFMLSQYLSHNQRDCLQCYNIIHNHFIMFYFIGKIPWENTMVNPIPWVCKTVDQRTSQKKISRVKVGEQV